MYLCPKRFDRGPRQRDLIPKSFDREPRQRNLTMNIIKGICPKYLLEVIMRTPPPGNALCPEPSACLILVATSTNIYGSLLLHTLRNTVFAKLGSNSQLCNIRNSLGHKCQAWIRQMVSFPGQWKLYGCSNRVLGSSISYLDCRRQATVRITRETAIFYAVMLV
jgi:hypothetical protein